MFPARYFARIVRRQSIKPQCHPYQQPYQQFYRDINQRIGVYKPGLFRKAATTILFIILIVLASWACVIGLLFINPDLIEAAEPILIVLIIVALPVILLFSIIESFYFIYRCWRTIQDGYAQTTPGEAVGFLFIPIFNIYWIFVAFYGLANGLNAYCDRYNIGGPDTRVNSRLVFCE